VSGNDNLDEESRPIQASDGATDTAGPIPRAPGAPTPNEAGRARREAGARREVNDAVVFHHDDQTIEGWALNISGGGLRAIFDESLTVGDEFEMTLGDDSQRRPVRVVWAREEKGGAIVGVAFLDIANGSIPPPPSMTPPPGAGPASTPPLGPDKPSGAGSDDADPA
jgi:hypothetical protein